MCKTLRLTINMRARDSNHAKWLLDVGDRTIPSIFIPEEWRTDDIVAAIYGDTVNFSDELSNRVILACHNDDVRSLNKKVLSTMAEEPRTYFSVDFAKPKGMDQLHEQVQLDYQIDYLKLLSFPGFPIHKQQLKAGAVVMLLRNLSIKAGLCN